MTSGEKRDSIYFTYLACEVVSISIVTVHYIGKIGFLVNKAYRFIYKFIQVIPECFLWPVGMTAAGHPDNTGFFIDYFNLSFISCRHPLINYTPRKKIHFSDLWMKGEILQQFQNIFYLSAGVLVSANFGIMKSDQPMGAE